MAKAWPTVSGGGAIRREPIRGGPVHRVTVAFLCPAATNLKIFLYFMRINANRIHAVLRRQTAAHQYPFQLRLGPIAVRQGPRSALAAPEASRYRTQCRSMCGNLAKPVGVSNAGRPLGENLSFAYGTQSRLLVGKPTLGPESPESKVAKTATQLRDCDICPFAMWGMLQSGP